MSVTRAREKRGGCHPQLGRQGEISPRGRVELITLYVTRKGLGNIHYLKVTAKKRQQRRTFKSGKRS